MSRQIRRAAKGAADGRRRQRLVHGWHSFRFFLVCAAAPRLCRGRFFFIFLYHRKKAHGGISMVYQISNELLTLAIDGTGGAMQHMVFDDRSTSGKAIPPTGGNRRHTSSPLSGRLTKGRCTMDGDPVTLDVHGFFRRRPMELAAREADRLTLVQTWDAETYAAYPRKWRVLLTYALASSTVRITFLGGKPGRKAALFLLRRPSRLQAASGGRPGLRGLLRPVTRRSPAPAAARHQRRVYDRRGAGLPAGAQSAAGCAGTFSTATPVILEGTGGEATLLAPGHRRQVTVSYPQMRYLGIWQPAGTDAPFLCLEPWCACPTGRIRPPSSRKRRTSPAWSPAPPMRTPGP